MTRALLSILLVLAWCGCSSSSTNPEGTGGGVSTGGAGGGPAGGSGGGPAGGASGGPSGGAGGAPSGGAGGAPSGGAAGSSGSAPCDLANCDSRAACCEAIHLAGAAEYRALIENDCKAPSWCLPCSQGGGACSYICQAASSASLYDCLACTKKGCSTTLQGLDIACAKSPACNGHRKCLTPCP